VLDLKARIEVRRAAIGSMFFAKLWAAAETQKRSDEILGRLQSFIEKIKFH
jgi:hypothetical protein